MSRSATTVQSGTAAQYEVRCSQVTEKTGQRQRQGQVYGLREHNIVSPTRCSNVSSGLCLVHLSTTLTQQSVCNIRLSVLSSSVQACVVWCFNTHPSATAARGATTAAAPRQYLLVFVMRYVAFQPAAVVLVAASPANCTVLHLCTTSTPTATGDNHPVSIGHNTNLQDGVFVGDMNPLGRGTSVGSFVSVGHGAVLKGCSVGDKALVGMNAVLQEGVTVS